jgi:type II secretory pathway pseudopilin PulG
VGWRRTEPKSFFPWERRGGLLRRLGLYRLRPLVLLGLVLGLLALVLVRERRSSGIRRTRALLLDVREAIDAYRADHKGRCPGTFAELSDYGAVDASPADAWGQPLTLICSGRAGDPYRLISAGPDGIVGGLDRIE